MDVGRYVCSYCRAKFSNGASLEMHLMQNECGSQDINSSQGESIKIIIDGCSKNREPSPDGVFICGECRQCFSSGDQLAIHIDCHRNESTDTVFECGKCSAVFKTSRLLESHVKSSNCIVSDIYTCGMCNEVFVNKAELEGHLLNNQCLKSGAKKPESEYVCGVCKKNFDSAHILIAHTTVCSLASLPTESCRVNTVPLDSSTVYDTINNSADTHEHSTNNDVTLNETKDNKNNAEMSSFKCVNCNRFFVSLTKYQTHKRWQTCQKYKSTCICRYCGKTFSSSFYTKIHEKGKCKNQNQDRINNIDNIQWCRHCRQPFTSWHDLAVHENSNICMSVSSNTSRKELAKQHIQYKSIPKGTTRRDEGDKETTLSSQINAKGSEVATKTVDQNSNKQLDLQPSDEATIDQLHISGISFNQDTGEPITMYHDLPVSSFVPELTTVTAESAVQQDIVSMPYISPPPLPPNIAIEQAIQGYNVVQRFTPVTHTQSFPNTGNTILPPPIPQPYPLLQAAPVANYPHLARSIQIPLDTMNSHSPLQAVGPGDTNYVYSAPILNVPHYPPQTFQLYNESGDSFRGREVGPYPSTLKPHLQRPATDVRSVSDINTHYPNIPPASMALGDSNNTGFNKSKGTSSLQKYLKEQSETQPPLLHIVERLPHVNWYFMKYTRTNRNSTTSNTPLLMKMQRLCKVVDNIQKCKNKTAGTSVVKQSDTAHVYKFKRMHLRMFNQQWMQKKQNSQNTEVTVDENVLRNRCADSEGAKTCSDSLLNQKQNLIHTLLEKRALLNKLKETIKLHKTGLKSNIPDKGPPTGQDVNTITGQSFGQVKVTEGILTSNASQRNLEITSPPIAVNSDTMAKIVIPKKGPNPQTVSRSHSKMSFPAPRTKTVIEQNISVVLKDNLEKSVAPSNNVQDEAGIEKDAIYWKDTHISASGKPANTSTVDMPVSQGSTSRSKETNTTARNTPVSSQPKVKWSMLGGKPIVDKPGTVIPHQSIPNHTTLSDKPLHNIHPIVENITMEEENEEMKTTTPGDSVKRKVSTAVKQNGNTLREQTNSVLVHESQVMKVQVYLQRLDSNFINKIVKTPKVDKEHIASKETSKADLQTNNGVLKGISSKLPSYESISPASDMDKYSESESDSDSEGYEEIDVDIDEDDYDENLGKQTCVDTKNSERTPLKDTKYNSSTNDSVTHSDSSSNNSYSEAEERQKTNTSKKKPRHAGRMRKGVNKQKIDQTWQPAVSDSSSTSGDSDDDMDDDMDDLLSDTNGGGNKTTGKPAATCKQLVRKSVSRAVLSTHGSSSDASNDGVIVRKRPRKAAVVNTSSSSTSDSEDNMTFTERKKKQKNKTRIGYKKREPSKKKENSPESGSRTECQYSEPDEKRKPYAADKNCDTSVSSVNANVTGSNQEITIETDYDTYSDMQDSNSLNCDSGSNSEFDKKEPTLMMTIRNKSSGRKVILNRSDSGSELCNETINNKVSGKTGSTQKVKSSQAVMQTVHAISNTGISENCSTAQKTLKRSTDINDSLTKTNSKLHKKGRRNISKRLSNIKFDSSSDGNYSGASADVDLTERKINTSVKTSDTSNIDTESGKTSHASANNIRKKGDEVLTHKVKSSTEILTKNTSLARSSTKRKRNESDKNEDAPSKKRQSNVNKNSPNGKEAQSKQKQTSDSNRSPNNEKASSKKRQCKDTKHSKRTKHLPTSIINQSIQQTQDLNKEEFVCGICQEAYPNLSELEQHMSDHAAEKASAFVCGMCQKCFQEDLELQKHIVEHLSCLPSGLPAVFEVCVCEWCKQKFTNADQLLEHKKCCGKKNMESTKYSCKVCSQKFGHIETLNEHQKFCDSGNNQKDSNMINSNCEPMSRHTTDESVNSGITAKVQADSSKEINIHVYTINSAITDKPQDTDKEKKGIEKGNSATVGSNRLAKLLKFKPKTVFSWQ